MEINRLTPTSLVAAAQVAVTMECLHMAVKTKGTVVLHLALIREHRMVVFKPRLALLASVAVMGQMVDTLAVSLAEMVLSSATTVDSQGDMVAPVKVDTKVSRGLEAVWPLLTLVRMKPLDTVAVMAETGVTVEMLGMADSVEREVTVDMEAAVDMEEAVVTEAMVDTKNITWPKCITITN